ncbi:MAG: response regulator [Burkholderiaceae bacterium]
MNLRSLFVSTQAAYSQALHGLPDAVESHGLHIAGVSPAFAFRHQLNPDGSGRFLETVGDIEAMFGPGFSQEQILSDDDTIWRHCNRADLGRVLALLRESATNSRPVSMDAVVHLPSRGRRVFRIRLFGAFTANGRLLNTGAAADITEVPLGPDTQFHSDLSYPPVSASPPRIDAHFLGQLARQIRTSLNVMQGFAQLLPMDRSHPVAAIQLERLGNIELACRRIEALIDGVKDVAFADDGRRQIIIESLDIEQVIQESLLTVEPQADALGLSLSLSSRIDRPGVLADRRALGLVMREVLSTAIRLNQASGSVVIGIDLCPVANHHPKRCRVQIKAAGPGLSKEQTEHLFQPFYKSEHSRKSGDGASTGLMVSRSLLHSMDGSIRVFSGTDGGNTFEIELPAAVDAVTVASDSAFELLRAAESRPGLVQPMHNGPLRIIYVEDDRLNSLLIKNVLGQISGFELLTADDGRSAWEMILEEVPHLLIADINLPFMNGDALVRAVRSNPDTRHINCVALSADTRSEEIERIMKAGFNDFWPKPIDVYELIHRIQQLDAGRFDA